jgi:predicted nuclease with TOPRIM domain
MAQDFYAAFQLNGTDSLGINSISIDGVNMAGVQALEKRTSEMKAVIDFLVKENKELKEKFSNASIVNEELQELRKLKAELQEQLKIVKAKTERENVASITK